MLQKKYDPADQLFGEQLELPPFETPYYIRLNDGSRYLAAGQRELAELLERSSEDRAGAMAAAQMRRS